MLKFKLNSKRVKNPAGPLLMINPKKRKKRNYKAKKIKIKRISKPAKKIRVVKIGSKFPRWKNSLKLAKRRAKPKKMSLKRRRNSMAKSRKRSLAAKRAWRKRRRSLVANPRRIKRRLRKRNKRSKSKSKRKRVLYGKPKISTYYGFKRKRITNKRRKYRRRNAWVNDHPGHVTAGKKHWTRRTTGYAMKGKKKVFLETISWPHRRYAMPTGLTVTGKGKKAKRIFPRWKNPKHFIRVRNPDGIKDLLMPIGLGVGGFLISALLMSKIPQEYKDKMVVGGFNLSVLIPGVAGYLLAKYGSKYMPNQSKLLYGLSFGLMLTSGIGIYNSIAKMTAKDGKQAIPSVTLSGYTLYPMTGYVPSSSMTGYVLGGDVEEYAPRSLGADESFSRVEVRGELESANVPVPAERALAYQPLAVKPYGLGLPREERRYNEYSWSGVYDNSVYE